MRVRVDEGSAELGVVSKSPMVIPTVVDMKVVAGHTAKLAGAERRKFVRSLTTAAVAEHTRYEIMKSSALNRPCLSLSRRISPEGAQVIGEFS